MKPFALSYAHARTPEVTELYTYDAQRQLNVLSDGTPAVERGAVLMATGSTSSTAGSKTHSDDD